MLNISRAAAVLTVAGALLNGSIQAEDQPPGTGKAAPSRPEPFDEERALVSFEGTREVDPGGQELHGMRVGVGSWDESECDFNGRGLLWLGAASGGRQRVARGGVDAGLILLGGGPVRILVDFGLGLEYRAREPHTGLGAFVTGGFETAVWLGTDWQVALRTDRFLSSTSIPHTQASLVLRWSPRRLPWWPIAPASRPDLGSAGRSE